VTLPFAARVSPVSAAVRGPLMETLSPCLAPARIARASYAGAQRREQQWQLQPLAQ